MGSRALGQGAWVDGAKARWVGPVGILPPHARDRAQTLSPRKAANIIIREGSDSGRAAKRAERRKRRRNWSAPNARKLDEKTGEGGRLRCASPSRRAAHNTFGQKRRFRKTCGTMGAMHSRSRHFTSVGGCFVLGSWFFVLRFSFFLRRWFVRSWVLQISPPAAGCRSPRSGVRPAADGSKPRSGILSGGRVRSRSRALSSRRRKEMAASRSSRRHRDGCRSLGGFAPRQLSACKFFDKLRARKPFPKFGVPSAFLHPWNTPRPLFQLRKNVTFRPEIHGSISCNPSRKSPDYPVLLCNRFPKFPKFGAPPQPGPLVEHASIPPPTLTQDVTFCPENLH
jgi:hypothetical protein